MGFVTNDSLSAFLDRIKKPEPTQEKPTPKLKGVDFFQNTYADGFTLGKNPTDTDFILEGFPRTNFLDKRGNVNLLFDENNKFSVSVNNEKSRLLDLHTKPNPTIPYLGAYYSQLTSKGRLGIRNNDAVGFDQPFVVREIGNKLGFDGVEDIPGLKNNTIAKVLDFTGGLLNDIGGAVLGREPSEYLGASANSLTRTAKFLATSKGAAFLIKQNTLIKRNPKQQRADVRYGINNNSIDKTQNLRKYNPLSIGSLPGVTKISIYALDPNQVITPYFDTIASRISQQAISLAEKVGTELIDLGSNIVGSIRGSLSKLPGASGVSNFINTKIVQPVSNTIDNLKEQANTIDAKRREIGEIFENTQNAILDKETLVKIDPQSAASVGVDKVNLIPYGTREEAKVDGKDESTLDFIPFRFKDVVGNKVIVFRAILSGITDTFTPEYSSERYVGRPDNVYVYQGTTREISFTLDIYPKSDQELVTLWEKMNYLAGLTYPHVANASGGGQGMISPICELTMGDMYRDTPGYISGLTYTVQENGTWETTFAKLPKYIQASVTFVYIGKYQQTATQKHFDVDWVGDKEYQSELLDEFDIRNDSISKATLSLKDLKKFIA